MVSGHGDRPDPGRRRSKDHEQDRHLGKQGGALFGSRLTFPIAMLNFEVQIPRDGRAGRTPTVLVTLGIDAFLVLGAASGRH